MRLTSFVFRKRSHVSVGTIATRTAAFAALLTALLTASSCSESGERCRIDGRSYPDRAANPANRCEVCSPALNADGWTPLGDGTECGVDLVCHENACKQVCFEGAHRVAPGEKHPLEPCRECVSDATGASRFAPSGDGAECGDDGRCLSGYCVDACFIDGVVHDDGRRDPRNPCRQCLTKESTTSWSIGVDGPYVCSDRAAFCLGGVCTPGCFIDGEAVPLDTTHPSESCLVCPRNGSHGWSALPDRTSCGAALECRSGACVPRRLDLVATRVGEGNHFAAFASSTELLVGGDSGLWRSAEGTEWEIDSEQVGAVVHLARKPGPLSAVHALDANGALWQGGFGARWTKLRSDLEGARAFWSAPDGSALFVVGDAGLIWSGATVAELTPVVRVPGDSGSDRDLNDVHGVSATEAWVVGEAGTVLHFDGVDFHEVEVNVSADLHAVRVLGHRIVAVGSDATVLRSADGGATWEVDHPSAALGADLFALAIAGDDLVAVGAHGTFLLSSDGGETWRQQEVSVFETLTSAGAEEGRVVAAGTGGRVVVSR